MYHFVEKNDKEFVKEMYNDQSLCIWGDWGEYSYNRAYEFLKNNHYLKNDEINFYRVSSDLIREVYPIYGEGGAKSWVVILTSDLNLNLNDDDEYLKIIQDGGFKLFNEIIDNLEHKDDPEYQKQSWIEYMRKNYKTVDNWIEQIIPAYSYHEPIPEDQLQVIKNCKTWEDVYHAYQTVVQYLPR